MYHLGNLDKKGPLVDTPQLLPTPSYADIEVWCQDDKKSKVEQRRRDREEHENMLAQLRLKKKLKAQSAQISEPTVEKESNPVQNEPSEEAQQNLNVSDVNGVAPKTEPSPQCYFEL